MYYREHCIKLKCPHRKYAPTCNSCCTRRQIAIFCDPDAFVRAHCNPNPKQWNNGFPKIFTTSAEYVPKDIYTGKYKNITTGKPTTTRIHKKRYTTPRHNAQDMRRTDWSEDQKTALATAYQCLGQRLGAKKPKIEENYYKHTTTPSNPKQTQSEKSEKQEPKTHHQQIEQSETNKTQTVARITTTQEQTNQNDSEIQKLVQQILENHDHKPITSHKTTLTALQTETSPKNEKAPSMDPDHKTQKTLRTNIIRLCLCSDPQCPAKQGYRPTKTEEMPPVAYVQTNNKNTTKTIQIQFDEYVPIHWEANAAYLKCHSNSTPIKSLIDTGSVISILSDEKARQISSQPEWKEGGGTWDRRVNIKAYGCTNTQLDLIGRITIPKFRLKNNQQLPNKVSFWVLRNSSEECIISGEWLINMKATLSMPHKLLYYSVPKTDLSAGGDQYVITEIIPATSPTEPHQPMDAVPQDIQRIQEQLKEKQPTILANQHYSITLGPTKKLHKPELVLLIDGLPAKTSIKQNKIMLHIANTTQHDRKLSGKSKITQTPQPIKMQTHQNFEASKKHEISILKGF